MKNSIIIIVPIKTEDERLEYCSWISRTGISCAWDYITHRKVPCMAIELEPEDAAVFRLTFGK